MNWKLKCLAVHLLDRIPAGSVFHGFLQRHVTGRYFQKITPAQLAAYEFHVANFPGGVAMEFGAGRNLLAALLLSHAGAARVYAFDLTRHATLEQVNGVIDQLRALRGGAWPRVTDLGESLTRFYRIEYLAPGDARATGLAADSIDFVYSQSTLEHIPPIAIGEILTECKRVLKPAGSMSFIIDYHDHYASCDASISFWNFYRYSARAWRMCNPNGHFQNRLRHRDFQKLFAELGLTASIDRRIVQRASDLARTRIASDFAHYPIEDLTTANGHFLLGLH